SGASMALLPPDTQRDPTALAELVADGNVSILQLVPSLLPALLEQPAGGCWVNLRRLFCGGEALSGHLLGQCRTQLGALGVSNLEVHNLYGPTETCIDATFQRCGDADTSSTIPIGRPIANTQVYVLDDSLCLVPPGVTGE